MCALRTKHRHAPPTPPRIQCWTGCVLSWRCEFLSVRTASLRSLPGASTLNFGGTGGEQIALPKSNAQIFVLRTFVLQPSLYSGLASTYRACARDRDAHNRSTHAILHNECDAHVLLRDTVSEPAVETHENPYNHVPLNAGECALWQWQNLR